MNTTLETSVVIVGAGPTGLSLACQLARYSVDFVILDKNASVTPFSKAIGVHARTLEIYEQIGLAQKAIEEGTIAGQVRLLAGGEVRGELDLSSIGQGLSPYPCMLLLEQSKNERLLYEHLQSHKRDVLWNTQFESLSQDDSGVTAQVRVADGTLQAIKARYLVGCDGAKSPIRHTLGLEFEGNTFERMFYVADAHVDWAFSHDALHICISEHSALLFFPLKGENRYRIVGSFPEGFEKDEGDILYEEIENHIKAEAKLELDIHDVQWFSTYKVHTRHVSRFSQGRCFLAGDCAHIHTPAGAQGMNTGIQDGYNLAWKMALVTKDLADEKILSTYNEERLENAKNLLQTTDRLFQLGAGTQRLLVLLRTNVLPLIAKPLLDFDVVKKFVFPMLSQIGISYRHSSLSQHAGDENFKVKSGDRMPYFLIDGQSVYDQLHQPKFHLLTFGAPQHDFQELQTELESHASEMFDFHLLPCNSEVTEIFGTNQPFHVLLRPDNYIGFISTGTATSALKLYLDGIAGR